MKKQQFEMKCKISTLERNLLLGKQPLEEKYVTYCCILVKNMLSIILNKYTQIAQYYCYLKYVFVLCFAG